MKKIILLISFIFLLISDSSAETPIRFFKEEIIIELSENSIYVRGLYFFDNRSNFEIDATIVYPFPVDTNHLYPNKIEVFDPKHPIDFVKRNEGIEWTLHFEPIAVETVVVEYKQIIKEESATYILEKLWKEKIDKAMFTIETPLDFKELNLSIKPDSVKIEENKQVYYITKRYFLPKGDLKITW